MTDSIKNILPAKKFTTTWEENTPDGLYKKGYNKAIDDCAAALSKHNLVVCPSEDDLMELICASALHEDAWKYNSLNDDIENALIRRHVSKLAKALLALLGRSKPQGANGEDK